MVQELQDLVLIMADLVDLEVELLVDKLVDLELVVLEHRHLVAGQLDMVIMEELVVLILDEVAAAAVLVALGLVHQALQHLAEADQEEHLVSQDLQ